MTGVFFALAPSSIKGQSPTIIITNLPAYGTQGNLGGLVMNANPATNSVAVYIYVSGAWYSKPSCASALTPIQPDGSWTANITTSGSDPNATEIAAFLVPTNYDQACVNGAAGLTIPSQAEAVVYANRVSPGLRRFNFSGYGWSVRNTTAASGPGPNYFSNSTNNVWLDAQGQLHMKITHTNGVWECAEVTSDRSFGYGQYRFTVSAPINNLDPNVVLGLFTYSNDNVYNYREVDVELSRWKNPADANDAQFVIQPAGAGQKLRFSVPGGVTNSTYSFIWQTNRVDFQSLNGDFTSSPLATNLLKTWTCTLSVPPAGGETVHINLWLFQGTAPSNNQEVEVVISNFEFLPLGPPQPAQLGQLNLLPGGDIELNAQGLADWRYQILTSSDLVNWQEIGTVLATNSSIAYSALPALFQFIDTNPVSLDSSFYRTVTEP
ncbi:MAG TPA: glycoside hydrolase family 16 protein [Verrucomicrobiae bacterium]|nr:glycoside hydrolase family 16 protein [Verrucomicrobiae bacterium]